MVAAVASTDRAQHLIDTCAVLWPQPAAAALTGAGLGLPAVGRASWPSATSQATDSEFILLFGTRRPRLLIPTVPAAASAAVRGYSAVGSRSARLGAGVLSLALRTRVGQAAFRSRLSVRVPPGADTIESFLADALGSAVMVSLYVGPARANRKPILQLLSPDGRPVGFAKVGTNPLTRALVLAESQALARLGGAGLAGITVPEVLFYGVWRGMNILVQTALPVWQRRRSVAGARLAAAMIAVAQVGGLRREPLANSPYWRQLMGRLAAADQSAARDRLLSALSTLSAHAGDAIVLLGSWHGDWTPWNMASTRSGLLVWDWERFSDGVPLGFDALHYRLQEDLVSSHRDPGADAASCIENAADVLAPFEITGSQARLICILYLADLATRYLCDRQAEAGAPLGAVSGWLIPAITGQVNRLCLARADRA